jgi:hypothetical protein
MELFIKHRRPLQDFSSGKWVNRDLSFVFYVIKDNKRTSVQPREETRGYILNLTIENPNVPGKYNQTEDCLLYVLDMDKNNLVIEDTKIENLILISFIKVP